MKSFALRPRASAETLTFDWGQLDWFADGPSDSSDHLTVGQCTLKPGQQNPRHYHPNCEEVLHLVTGSIDHYVEDEGWLPMKPGDTITVAANVWHQARNTGDGPATMIICFSSAHRETVGE